MNDIAINSAQVRDVLRKLYDSDYLSAHPLAKLAAVAKMRDRLLLPDLPASNGIALRALLVELIDQLGQQPATQRYQKPLKLQYIDRQKTNDLAEAMSVAERTFYLAQNRALKYLAQTLVHMELQASTGATLPTRTPETSTETPATDAPSTASVQPMAQLDADTLVEGPFLAPTRPALPLVGRDEMLATVRRDLFGNKGGVTALLGLPGMGKTALATALAHDPDVLAEFPHGVLWTSLDAATDVNGALAVWLAALGMAAPDIQLLQTPTERAQHVRARIGTRRMLLVLDHANDYASLSLFLLGGPNSAHLVTTQSPNAAAELATYHTVSDLAEADAQTLLDEGVGRQVTLAPEAKAEVLRMCGGMPLALRVAARRLRQTHGDPERVASALQSMADPQTFVALDQPQALGEHHGRPWSVRTALDTCYAPLSDAARITLVELATLPHKPHTWSLGQIQAVALDGSVVDELLGCGLLEQASGGNYALHPVVSAYVRAVKA